MTQAAGHDVASPWLEMAPLSLLSTRSRITKTKVQSSYSPCCGVVFNVRVSVKYGYWFESVCFCLSSKFAKGKEVYKVYKTHSGTNSSCPDTTHTTFYSTITASVQSLHQQLCMSLIQMAHLNQQPLNPEAMLIYMSYRDSCIQDAL